MLFTLDTVHHRHKNNQQSFFQVFPFICFRIELRFVFGWPESRDGVVSVLCRKSRLMSWGLKKRVSLFSQQDGMLIRGFQIQQNVLNCCREWVFVIGHDWFVRSWVYLNTLKAFPIHYIDGIGWVRLLPLYRTASHSSPEFIW